ncbi:zinc finger protein [Kutzneria kofuensis]|uniref:Zinc finger protein n=1 Tax=Kutzneria kofuensis TaxID=103725 RepID=A0A7W9KSJ5_9PSEU|nr:zinc finger protein [Kutzneria kofuensis]MBB5897956.1 hypothetical protein [Kutzneria kofuensis]
MNPCGQLPQPHFTWQPAALRRHCYLADHPAWPGTELPALCGVVIVSRRADRDEWWWPTCPHCYDEARRIQLRWAG